MESYNMQGVYFFIIWSEQSEISHSKMQNSMQARFVKSLFSVSQKNKFRMT